VCPARDKGWVSQPTEPASNISHMGAYSRSIARSARSPLRPSHCVAEQSPFCRDWTRAGPGSRSQGNNPAALSIRSVDNCVLKDTGKAFSSARESRDKC
jgi:hypothetical protein